MALREAKRRGAKVIGISPDNAVAATTAYDPTCGSGSLLLKVAAEAGVRITLEGGIPDDNPFVGALAGWKNAIYTYPEWNVEWMKQDNVVENSKTDEDREANAWALDYWDKRGLKTRTESIFEQRYGFAPTPCYEAGLVVPFHDWPGGGGNLNYPMVYQQGLASVIKDVEERMMALEMRIDNTDKLYFYQASLIVMRAVIRWANRYAELAREMAAEEQDDELLRVANRLFEPEDKP